MTFLFKKINDSVLTIKTNDFDALDKIRDHFSVLEKNFQYIKRCQAKNIRIDPLKKTIRKSVIKSNGEFEHGLLTDILLYIKSAFKNRTVNISLDDDIRNKLKFHDDNIDIDDIKVDDNNGKPRDYQIESMKKALKYMNGLFILATGAGKTLCCSMLIHNLLKQGLKKILFICPFPDLAKQTYEAISYNLQHYNYSVNQWYGKLKFDKNADILICGSDILRSKFKEYENDIKKYDAVIVDEVHCLKYGNKISDIIKQIPTTKKFGFTGTLPQNKLDKWSIIGKIGPVRYELKSASLRDDKFLTPVNILGLHITIPDRNGTYMDEIEMLGESNKLNETVASIASKTKGNTLILTGRLDHIAKLNSLDYGDKQVFTIQGDIPLDERADIKNAMEENDDVVVIAQVSTFSTGINVKNISNIIFPGTIGKSNIRIVQSIGRSLRLKEGKKMSTIIDMIPSTRYSLKHWDERKNIYKSESIPFKELILK